MGNADQLPDLIRRQALFRENAAPVEIHQTGDHNFNKVRAAAPGLPDQGQIFPEIFVLFADECSVMSRFAQRGQGRPVGDAVFLCQLSGPGAGAPAVAAVTEVSVTQRLVTGEDPVNEIFVGFLRMTGDGASPLDPVQDHVHMTVALCHVTSPFCRAVRSTR